LKAAILREPIGEIQPNFSDLSRGAELPLSYTRVIGPLEPEHLVAHPD
jgi:hypothetical protein